VQKAFSRYGNVTDCFLPKDNDTGQSRGFGFVTFETVREAEDAIDGMNGQELDGRTLRVNKPQPRSGGGGGGGYPGTEKSQYEMDYRELHGVAPPRGKQPKYDRVTGDRLPD